VRVLAADVDEGLLGARRLRGDQDAFDDLVRPAFEQQPVLERTGLGLVGVADQVLRLVVAFGMNDHFRPVTKPAPPRPCRPAFFTSSTICSRSSR